MITRRNLIQGAGFLLTLPQSAVAGLSCQDIGPGIRTCTAGVAIQQIRPVLQRRLNWCWAACIEAIFAVHGHKVGQRRIVEKLFGDEIDAPAAGPQIVYAVDGDWEDDDGDSFEASAEVLWDTQFGFGRGDAIQQAAQELEADNPLILGAMGHAVLLTALTYTGNQFAVQINGAIVRDPWPLNPNRRQLTQLEAMQTQFLTKVSVT